MASYMRGLLIESNLVHIPSCISRIFRILVSKTQQLRITKYYKSTEPVYMQGPNPTEPELMNLPHLLLTLNKDRCIHNYFLQL
jgi:hypothetical protein